MYPKTIKDNLLFRIDINKQCQDDPNKIEALKELCRRDIVNFFDLCLWTYDPRKNPKHIPFVLYPFQEERARTINQSIADKKDLLIDKSRDMGVSWMTLGVFFYRWLFFNESFLVGSRKEELVDKLGDMDSLFEKIRYYIKFLYPFLMPNNITSSYMKIVNANGNIIAGESMNEAFGRAGRYNAILLDEFAHLVGTLADSIWQACGDSSPCRLPVSSPKGKINKFAKLRFPEADQPKIEVMTIHWSLHPEKDQAWYEKEKLRRNDIEVAQELDISYLSSAGKPFYAGFRQDLHVIEYEPLKDKELLFGWDYGWHYPCLVISQIDAKGRWVVYDMILGRNKNIKPFGEEVIGYQNLHYPSMTHKGFGDPAGKSPNDQTDITSQEILIGLGFRIESQPSNLPTTNYSARKKIIEGKLNTIIDGRPALLVHKRCQMIIEAFEGGYHYPEKDRYGREVESPFDDDWYAHPMNCIEYIAVNVFAPVPKDEKTEERIREMQRKRQIREGGYG